MSRNRAIAIEKQRSRYYRSAKAIARKALKTYTNQFGKDIKNCQDVFQMKQVAKKELRPDEIKAMMLKIYSEAGKHFGTQAYEALKPPQKRLANPGQQMREDYWFSWADKMIKGKLGQRIKWITETTKEQFISTIDKVSIEGFEQGWGIDKISDKIMKELNITERYRAERIARTEVIGASNSATAAGANASGIPLDKEWISYIDDNTRKSHIALNGVVVDQYDTFDNGLLYPGDPQGEAEDVINCRCAVGYLAKVDSEFDWGRQI